MPIIGRGNGKGTRLTKVARMFYWRPDIEQWTLCPVDLAHNVQVHMVDPETGNPMGTMGVPESKGWISLMQIPEKDERRKSLPENWREMCRDHKAEAVFAKKASSGAAA